MSNNIVEKECSSCNEILFFYAGFCHYCESIQAPKQPEYPELNNGRVSFKEGGELFGAHIKIEKLPNGVEILRKYSKEIFRIYEILEEWTENNGYKISQKWIGKWSNIEKFDIEKFNNKGWDPTCGLDYQGEELPYLDKSWTFSRNGYILTSNRSEEKLYKSTEYYFDTSQIRFCITYDRIKNKIIEGIYYNPDGKLVGTLNNEGSYVVLRHGQSGECYSEPIIHYVHEGDYMILSDSDPFNIKTFQEFELYYKILNREKKRDEKRLQNNG